MVAIKKQIPPAINRQGESLFAVLCRTIGNFSADQSLRAACTSLHTDRHLGPSLHRTVFHNLWFVLTLVEGMGNPRQRWPLHCFFGLPPSCWLQRYDCFYKNSKQGMWRATCEKSSAALRLFRLVGVHTPIPQHAEFFCGYAPFRCWLWKNLSTRYCSNDGEKRKWRPELFSEKAGGIVTVRYNSARFCYSVFEVMIIIVPAFLPVLSHKRQKAHTGNGSPFPVCALRKCTMKKLS